MRPLLSPVFLVALMASPPAWAQPLPADSAAPTATSAVPATPSLPATSPALSPAPAPPSVPPLHSLVLPPSDPSTAPREPATRQVRYGSQTLLADGISAGVLLLGLGVSIQGDRGSSEREMGNSILMVGAANYLLGAPIVHWAHGHVGRGFGSFGLRAGSLSAGVTGAAFLSLIFQQSSARTVEVAALTHVVLASAVPVVLDATVLAREEVPVEKVSVTPLVMPQRGGATLGLGGRF